MLFRIPLWWSFARRHWWGTVSKALLKSMITRSAWLLLSRIFCRSSTSTDSWASQDLPLRKPCCWSASIFNLSKCFMLHFRAMNSCYGHRYQICTHMEAAMFFPKGYVELPMKGSELWEFIASCNICLQSEFAETIISSPEIRLDAFICVLSENTNEHIKPCFGQIQVKKELLKILLGAQRMWLAKSFEKIVYNRINNKKIQTIAELSHSSRMGVGEVWLVSRPLGLLLAPLGWQRMTIN